MKIEFSLVDEPWIPVQTLQGEVREVSLREALLKAHHWKMIEDSNPLVVASLFRLLLAIVHRALEGPNDVMEREELFDAGQFPESRIVAYLEQYRARFNLFGTEPFLQVGDLQLDKTTSLAKLAVECSSGNNKALFEHSLDSQPRPLTFAQSARLLTAHQAFSLCGGVSGGGLKNFTDSASPRGAILVVLGRDLFQTLVANLVVYRDSKLQQLDVPTWEGPPVTYAALKQEQKGPAIAGPCVLYSWISRAVLLLPEAGECKACYYASGWIPHSSVSDPAVAYRVTKDDGLAPVRIQPDKAVWRDLCSLVPPRGQHGAQVIETLDLGLRKMLTRNQILPLLVLGQSAKPGKPVVESWTAESLPLPEGWLSEQGAGLVANVEQALRCADRVAFEGLREAVKTAARALTDKEQANRMVDSLTTEADYWGALRGLFFACLPALGDASILQGWYADCYGTARDAYAKLESLLGTGGDALRAWLLGRRELGRRLKKLEEEYPMSKVVANV